MAKILKRTGQCAIKYKEVEYIFTPSFLNIAQLGEETEIVKIFNSLNNELAVAETCSTEKAVRPHRLKVMSLSSISIDLLRSCLSVLTCMCDKEIPTEIIGKIESDFTYRLGVIPCNNLIVLAMSLMRSGLVGQPNDRSCQGNGDDDGFNCSKFITFAMGHFGISKADAENLTMIEFQDLFNSKYPAAKSKQDDDKDRKEAEQFYDDIIKARAEKANKANKT